MSFVCAIPLISSLFTGCASAPPLATGYVEGQYVLIAPVEISQIDQITVRRGDRYSAGQALVYLERRDAEIDLNKARAAHEQAKSVLENLSQGRRPEEIAVIEASLLSARLQAAEMARELARVKGLLDRGIAAQATYDLAETNNAVAAARVEELQANLSVARLPAREGEIKAARSAALQAEAQVENAIWRLSKRTLSAGQDGIVVDLIRSAGEVAGPQSPVLSVLPDGAVTLRLYVPEYSLSQIALGQVLQVGCDGCPAGLIAKINYISDGPEFTPPVIYSLENRQKLVYLIEALPLGESIRLKPGQIVNVDLGVAAK